MANSYLVGKNILIFSIILLILLLLYCIKTNKISFNFSVKGYSTVKFHISKKEVLKAILNSLIIALIIKSLFYFDIYSIIGSTFLTLFTLFENRFEIGGFLEDQYIKNNLVNFAKGKENIGTGSGSPVKSPVSMTDFTEENLKKHCPKHLKHLSIAATAYEQYSDDYKKVYLDFQDRYGVHLTTSCKSYLVFLTEEVEKIAKKNELAVNTYKNYTFDNENEYKKYLKHVITERTISDNILKQLDAMNTDLKNNQKLSQKLLERVYEDTRRGIEHTKREEDRYKNRDFNIRLDMFKKLSENLNKDK